MRELIRKKRVIVGIVLFLAIVVTPNLAYIQWERAVPAGYFEGEESTLQTYIIESDEDEINILKFPLGFSWKVGSVENGRTVFVESSTKNYDYIVVDDNLEGYVSKAEVELIPAVDATE